jgi:cyclin-dependent kinase 10
MHFVILFYLGAKRGLADNDVEEKQNDGPDPSAPITRKGVLTSFITGKPMPIPEQDTV